MNGQYVPQNKKETYRGITIYWLNWEHSYTFVIRESGRQERYLAPTIEQAEWLIDFINRRKMAANDGT